MITTYINRIGWFIGIILIQVLVLNNIHLLGYATPLLYIYFILKLDTELSRNQLLLWGFFMGLCIDILSNTPGMNAAATTFAAFIRPSVFNLFVSRDTPDNITPSYSSLGVSTFIKYTVVMVLLHHLVLMAIESFSFFNFTVLLLKIGGSALLSIVCILAVEAIRK